MAVTDNPRIHTRYIAHAVYQPGYGDPMLLVSAQAVETDDDGKTVYITEEPTPVLERELPEWPAGELRYQLTDADLDALLAQVGWRRVTPHLMGLEQIGEWAASPTGRDAVIEQVRR